MARSPAPAGRSRRPPGTAPEAQAQTCREDLSEHARPFLDHAHSRARLVHPVDRHLDDPVAAALGEEEELDVEAEPVGTDLAEELGGDLAAKEVESALRVRHVPHTERPDDQVEYRAHELAMRSHLARHRSVAEGARPHSE